MVKSNFIFIVELEMVRKCECCSCGACCSQYVCLCVVSVVRLVQWSPLSVRHNIGLMGERDQDKIWWRWRGKIVPVVQ